MTTARARRRAYPAQYPTIQAAIDAASSNDIIEVADGTWAGAGNKNLDFQAKAITLHSETGNREACIIDCENDGRFAVFGVGDTPVVESITIRNGNAATGGAALVNAAGSASFMDCVFKNCNTAGSWKYGERLKFWNSFGASR